MTETRVGLVVEATDKASAMLRTIGNIGKKSLDVVKKSAAAAISPLKGMGMAMIALNQGLELAKKGIELFRFLLLDNIMAMVEYRGEQDSINREFRQMGLDAQHTKAVLFDVLTPVILGVKDAFDNAGDSIVDYINLNRKMIATNVATFLADVGKILIDVVATGLLWASRAVSGLIEAWNLLKSAVQTVIAAMLSANSKLLDSLAEIAEWAGADKISASLKFIAKGGKELSDSLEEAADKNLTKVHEQITAQKEFEQALKEIKDVATEFVGDALTKVLDRIDHGWSRVRRQVVEAQHEFQTFNDVLKDTFRNMSDLSVGAGQDVFTAFKTIARGMESLHEEQKKVTKGMADLKSAYDSGKLSLEEFEKGTDALGAKQDEITGKFQEFGEAGVNTATNVGNAFGIMLGEVISGAITAEQMLVKLSSSMLTALLSFIEQAIMALAAKAAAEALAAHAFLPFVGIAVGMAAAATVFGLVKSLIGQIPGAQFGLRIRGGTPGVDSVPVAMQQGEVALDRRQTNLIDRFVARLEKGESRGIGGPAMAMAGGGIVVNYTRRTVTPERTAQTAIEVRELGRVVGRLQKRGMWPMGAM